MNAPIKPVPVIVLDGEAVTHNPPTLATPPSVSVAGRAKRFVYSIVTAALLAGCADEAPTVELVPATVVECPASDGRGYVLLVDGRADSFVCEGPGAPEAPDVIAGQLFCSAVVPELLITITARIVLTADGYVLGLCTLSAASVGLTSSQAFDPQAATCSLPSYGTDSLEPTVVSLTDSGVVLSGAIEGGMSCAGEEL